MLFTPPDLGQDMRHNGPIDQLWAMLDFTPQGRTGRGAEWRPQLEY
jgi:predicted dithiol-disulfide oxidoreductase (DUF899 family)